MNDLQSDVLARIQTYYNDLVSLLPKLALAVLIAIGMFLLARWVRKATRSRLSKNMDDPLLAIFLARVAKAIVLMIAVVMVMRVLGLDGLATGLLAGAGVGAFVIGFAFKDIGENFLAGIMLAFKRPFRIGDTVELNGVKGAVVALNLRDTHIKSFDGKDIYIPNANVVKNPVVNYTIDGFLRYDFPIGLAYGSDVGDAVEVITEVLKGVNGIIQDSKPPSVNVSELTPSTLNLMAYFWVDTFDKSTSALKIKTEAVDRTLNALTKAGFNLPGNIVELKNYSKEELRTSMRSS